MSAIPANRPSSAMSSMRTVIAAGGWTNGLLVLAWMLAILLSWQGIAEEKPVGLGAVLAAIMAMFWAMLGGSRLIALSVQATQMRLPHVARQNLRHGAAALLLTVAAPALLLVLFGSHPLSLNLAVLCVGLLLGLFWASIPPWLMFALLALGYLPFWLARLFDVTWTPALELPHGLMLAALALLVANACCWWHMARRQLPAQGWRTPLALAFANGMQMTAIGTQQAQYSSALFTQDTPIGHDLHRQPMQALAIALGPGFGRTTFKSILGTQGPVLAVAFFWLLLAQGGNDGARVALFFAPLLAISPALAPLMRLQTLFKLPGMGLHELALLPGLPRQPARALTTLLTRQMLLRMLPALAIMAATGLLLDAGRTFQLLLLWSCFGSVFLLQGAGLLALHSRPFRWVLGAVAVMLILAILASMLVATKTHASAWLLQAWQVTWLWGVMFAVYAQNRLRTLPHPWLGN
ncbi:conserved membrane hypothetical protein [uncultured Stenotrophomonas sp.]|uniref:Transmembrane protein n=1 Tax=uncultured Stenotrophomonas sp. TaxID=165438 RepID=A0A1Y5Q6Q0_9GAMM|nr:conserved membrane hypothetical protein [uncultured Stenotrophomonas sp.]